MLIEEGDNEGPKQKRRSSFGRQILVWKESQFFPQGESFKDNLWPIQGLTLIHDSFLKEKKREKTIFYSDQPTNRFFDIFLSLTRSYLSCFLVLTSQTLAPFELRSRVNVISKKFDGEKGNGSDSVTTLKFMCFWEYTRKKV